MTPLPHRSAWLIRGFDLVVRRLIRRQFSAVRISGGHHASLAAGHPTVIFMNHPSWWDPMTAWVVHQRLFSERPGYAPIDSRALEHYKFFTKLGFFGVQRDHPAGARQFLRTASAILNQPESVLWITPQGKFTDVRQRPVKLESGLAHLLVRRPETKALPLAVDYVFGQERRPEIWLRLGGPVHLKQTTTVDPEFAPKAVEQVHRSLEAALETSQDELTRDFLAGMHPAFEELERGSLGIFPGFDQWKRMTFKMRGKAYKAGHREAVA